MISLSEESFEPGALLSDFCRGRAEVGAVASFTGIARAEAGATTILELEAYPGFTESEIAKIAAQARERFGLADLLIRHRVGKIAPGEPIVFVATASAHRRAAFQACDFLMDYLKSRAPFWKKEHGPGGARWIEPRDQDHADIARWETDAPPEGSSRAAGEGVENRDLWGFNPLRPAATSPCGGGSRWSPPMNAPALVPGGKIDETKPRKSVRVAVLTVSDSRDASTDTSGDILVQRATDAGHELVGRAIVRDDVEAIRKQILAWVEAGAEAIISTGGTGITGRDVTPEAVRPLLDKEIDGFSVVFHLVSYQSVGLSTLQSRALAGIVKGCFIFCLPGSNGAVKDGWDKVIAAQLDSRHGPCNMVELMPRLLEK